MVRGRLCSRGRAPVGRRVNAGLFPALWARMGLSRPVEPSCRTSLHAFWPLHGPEKDLDLDAFQIVFGELHDLAKPFLTDRVFGELVILVLALQNSAAHGALTLFVTLDASFQRDVKEQKRRRHLAPLCEAEQIPSSLGGECGGIDDAQAIQCQPLLHQKLDEGKRLHVEALVAFVIANQGARPVGRNDLGWPKMAFGKCRFTAS